MSMTGKIDRLEVITSVAAPLVGGGEGADGPGDLRAGDVGVTGGAAARDRGRTSCSLGGGFMPRARSRRSAPAKRWWRPPSTGPCSSRCVNCSGCSARRPWRTRSCARRWIWRSQKKAVARTLIRSGRYAMKTVADTLGVARSNLAAVAVEASCSRRGRRPQPETDLLAEIKQIIAGTPTYGYRRVHVMVLTKASAMPFDCGLSSGVVQGRKPMLRASLRVSAAR